MASDAGVTDWLLWIEINADDTATGDMHTESTDDAAVKSSNRVDPHIQGGSHKAAGSYNGTLS